MSETLHAEAPLANSPEARNPDGSLKTPSTAQTADTSTGTTTSNPDSTSKVETKVEEKKVEGKETLLTKKDDEAKGAPEKYEAFTAPEGVTLNPEIITKAEGLFKEMGLTQAQAQSLVNFYAENARADSEAAVKAYEDQRTDWQTKTKSDPEIGKILPQVKQTVSKALDLMGDATLKSAFREALDVTGIGDHPAFIKGMYKLAQRLTEGTHVPGAGPATTGQSAPNSRPKSAGAALWPNLPSANG